MIADTLELVVTNEKPASTVSYKSKNLKINKNNVLELLQDEERV